MGNRGDVYERYYMPAFVDRDCQAIYLGSTRRDDLIKAVGRLARHERAPTALTDVQKFEISRDPELLELIEKRAKCVRDLKDNGFCTIKVAKGTRWYQKHQEIQADINTLRSQLKKKELERTIKEFHKTVHTTEVDQQLRGIRPAKILTPPTIKYELGERATVAKLLFEPLNGLTEDQILQVRIKLVENLVQLCKRQETPHQYKAPKKGPNTRHLDMSIDADDSDTDMDDTDTDISQGEADTNVDEDIDWDTKTLIDNKSDTDSMAPIEIEDRPLEL